MQSLKLHTFLSFTHFISVNRHRYCMWLAKILVVCSSAEHTAEKMEVCVHMTASSLQLTIQSGHKSPPQWSSHTFSASSHTHSSLMVQQFCPGAGKTFCTTQLCSGCGKCKQFWHILQATFRVGMEGGSAGSIEHSLMRAWKSREIAMWETWKHCCNSIHGK